MTDVRYIAYETLLLADTDGAGNSLTKDVLDKYSYLDKKDRSFLKRLIEGTTERRISIDYVLDLYSSVRTAKMKKQVKTVLRMGVYQLLYMEGVADHAAVNESVKLIRKTPQKQLFGFVNAVLRTVQQNRDDIAWPDRDKDAARYMSVMYSCPLWIVNKLLKEQPEADAEALLKLSVSVRPVTARINMSKVKDFCDLGEGITRSDICPNAVILDDYDNIADIPAVKLGLVCVQDISSIVAVSIAGIKEDDTVLDLCAAPGGKSLHAADLAVKGRVISIDVSKRKVAKIDQNISRCGFENITAVVGDSSVYDSTYSGMADVVIADVPCSGLGVMGRKNDIKYNLTEKSVDELVILQRKILENAVRYVKNGGTLLFCTCTCSEEENRKNMEYLVRECALTPVDFYEDLPQILRDESAKSGWLQLYGKDGLTDGFFMGKLRK